MEFLLAFSLGAAPFGGPPRPDPDDRWFAVDKVKHVAVSAAIQSATHLVLRANGRDYRTASWEAAALTMTVGVGKELWDRQRGRVFSLRDLGADAVGGGIGAIVMRQTAP